MRRFFRLYDAVIDALAWLCGATLAAVFLLIVSAVALRMTRIGEPDWILPVTEYALLFIGTLAAPWLLRERGHVAVDIIRANLSSAARRRLSSAIALGCMLLCALLVYFSIPVMAATWGEYEMRAFMMPKALLVAPVALALFLLSIGFLRALLGFSALYDEPGENSAGEL